MLVLKSQRDFLYCLFRFAESECLRLSFKGQNIKTEFHQSNQIHLYPWLDHKLQHFACHPTAHLLTNTCNSDRFQPGVLFQMTFRCQVVKEQQRVLPAVLNISQDVLLRHETEQVLVWTSTLGAAYSRIIWLLFACFWTSENTGSWFFVFFLI